MSHLVYITLYGETDGVILSRLDCIVISSAFFDSFHFSWWIHHFLDRATLEALKTVVCHMTTKITSLGGLERNAQSVVGDWNPSLVINPRPLSCSPSVCFATHLHPSRLPLHGAISKLISLFRFCFCIVDGFWFGMIQHSIRKLQHGLRF